MTKYRARRRLRQRSRRVQNRKSLRRFAAELQLGKARVDASAAHEFAVRARFDDAAFVHNQNSVGFLDRRQPMRDHKRRAVLHESVKRLLHSALAFGIERTRRFVEQQNGCVLQNGARNRNPLTLSARQRRTALAELAVVAVGQRPNELIGLRGRRGAANLR